MEKRYYTVAEVNALIPELKRHMTDLKEAREEIALRRLQIERMKREQQGKADPDRFFMEEAEIEFMLIAARQKIDHFIGQSIDIKDIDTGLVDFLTLIDGVEAYLCWRIGESEVRYWHGATEGFSGRKPLPRE